MLKAPLLFLGHTFLGLTFEFDKIVKNANIDDNVYNGSSKFEAVDSSFIFYTPNVANLGFWKI